jgi:hypothetical protein
MGNPSGESMSTYCELSLTHLMVLHLAAQSDECLECRVKPKHGDHHYCGRTCAHNAMSRAPALLEVPKGHVTFTSGKNYTPYLSPPDASLFKSNRNFNPRGHMIHNVLM